MICTSITCGLSLSCANVIRRDLKIEYDLMFSLSQLCLGGLACTSRAGKSASAPPAASAHLNQTKHRLAKGVARRHPDHAMRCHKWQGCMITGCMCGSASNMTNSWLTHISAWRVVEHVPCMPAGVVQLEQQHWAIDMLGNLCTLPSFVLFCCGVTWLSCSVSNGFEAYLREW